MPKHVGVFSCVIQVVLRIAFVGKYVDCRNMHVVTLDLLIVSDVTTGGVHTKQQDVLGHTDSKWLVFVANLMKTYNSACCFVWV